MGAGIQFGVERINNNDMQTHTGSIESYGFSNIPGTEDQWGMRFVVKDNDTLREIITLSPLNRCGINNSNPQSTLDVTGTIKATSVDTSSLILPDNNLSISKINTLQSTLDSKQSQLTTGNGILLSGNAISVDATLSLQSMDVSNITIDNKIAISMDICNNYTLSISGDVLLKGSLFDQNGIEFGGGTGGGTGGIFTPYDNINYYTTKNVNIGTSDICDNFRLNVAGGVRIHNNGVYDTSLNIISVNNWIHDFSQNIFFNNGKVGIGTMTHDDDSILYVNGKITADIMNLLSDKRLKYNIEPIHNSLDIMRQLQPKKYNKYKSLYGEIGFIANDILDIHDISYLVSRTGEYYSLNYNSLFSLSIQCIKDLDTQLQTEKRDNELKYEKLMINNEKLMINNEKLMINNEKLMNRIIALEEKMDSF